MADASLIVVAVAVANLFVTIGGGIFFWGRVVQRLDEHAEARKETTTNLNKFIQTFQNAAINHAKVETRLEHVENNLDRVDTTVEDLRRGKGWIRDRDIFQAAKSIDREYGG